MAASSALQSAIQTFLSAAPNPSGIPFPSVKDVISKRLKAQGYSDESIKTIPASSPIMLNTTQEISMAKTLINHVMNQIPLLAVPITAPMAIQEVNAHLPAALTALEALGIDPPEALLPIFQALATAADIIKAGKSALSGPLSPLGSVLGL